jgi:hypothetical protein
VRNQFPRAAIKPRHPPRANPQVSPRTSGNVLPCSSG